jgi:aspartate kinase
VADFIASTVERGDEVVVTVSAMGNETDELLGLAPRVSSVACGRELDMLITAGERKAMALLCLALHELCVPAMSLSGSDAGIITDNDHTRAHVLDVQPERIVAARNQGAVPVIGGAWGISKEGEVTFLGRGGSDTTAVAVAAALGADACELFTDVAGVFTADPRIVPDAQLIERIRYEEMLAMCVCGCPKPARSAVVLAKESEMPMHVRPAFTWESGTQIGNQVAPGVRAIVCDQDRGRVSIVGASIGSRRAVTTKIVDALSDAGIAVDRIQTEPLRVTCTLPPRVAARAARTLHSAFGLDEPEPRVRRVKPAVPRASRELEHGGR